MKFRKGWLKTLGNWKTRHRGEDRVGWVFTLTAAAYNLVRIRNLTAMEGIYSNRGLNLKPFSQPRLPGFCRATIILRHQSALPFVGDCSAALSGS